MWIVKIVITSIPCAKVTFEWSFAIMSPKMVDQMMFLCKSLVTNSVFVGSLASMSPLLILQMLFLGEMFITNITFEWFFTSVKFFMAFQVRWMWKYFFTNITLIFSNWTIGNLFFLLVSWFFMKIVLILNFLGQ